MAGWKKNINELIVKLNESECGGAEMSFHDHPQNLTVSLCRQYLSTFVQPYFAIFINELVFNCIFRIFKPTLLATHFYLIL